MYFNFLIDNAAINIIIIIFLWYVLQAQNNGNLISAPKPQIKTRKTVLPFSQSSQNDSSVTPSHPISQEADLSKTLQDFAAGQDDFDMDMDVVDMLEKQGSSQKENNLWQVSLFWILWHFYDRSQQIINLGLLCI